MDILNALFCCKPLAKFSPHIRYRRSVTVTKELIRYKKPSSGAGCNV